MDNTGSAGEQELNLSWKDVLVSSYTGLFSIKSLWDNGEDKAVEFAFDGVANIENIALKEGAFDTHLVGILVDKESIKFKVFAPLETNSIEFSPFRKVIFTIPTFGSEKKIEDFSACVKFSSYSIEEQERFAYLEMESISDAEHVDLIDLLSVLINREELKEKAGALLG
tara:strand:+ start:3280 stop:3786 length:507 start_codon:yes stop_codon:yes gene_type:complete